MMCKNTPHALCVVFCLIAKKTDLKNVLKNEHVAIFTCNFIASIFLSIIFIKNEISFCDTLFNKIRNRYKDTGIKRIKKASGWTTLASIQQPRLRYAL